MNSQFTENNSLNDAGNPGIPLTTPITIGSANLTTEPINGLDAPSAPPVTNVFPVYEPIALTEQIDVDYARQPAASRQMWGPIPERPISRKPRIGTMLWGFILLAVGLNALARGFGRQVDAGLGLIWILAIAGAGLLFAAVFSAAKAARRH